MPRTPYKEPADDEIVERLVPMPGWVYKKMIARANAQQRTTKYQISHELVQLTSRMLEAGVEDNSPGNRTPAGMSG